VDDADRDCTHPQLPSRLCRDARIQRSLRVSSVSLSSAFRSAGRVGKENDG
jgi:hypothetical protein